MIARLIMMILLGGCMVSFSVLPLSVSACCYETPAPEPVTPDDPEEDAEESDTEDAADDGEVPEDIPHKMNLSEQPDAEEVENDVPAYTHLDRLNKRLEDLQRDGNVLMALREVRRYLDRFPEDEEMADELAGLYAQLGLNAVPRSGQPAPPQPRRQLPAGPASQSAGIRAQQVNQLLAEVGVVRTLN